MDSSSHLGNAQKHFSCIAKSINFRQCRRYVYSRSPCDGLRMIPVKSQMVPGSSQVKVQMQIPLLFNVSRASRLVDLLRALKGVLGLLAPGTVQRLLMLLGKSARHLLGVVQVSPVRFRFALENVRCTKEERQTDLRAASSKDACCSGLLTVILSMQIAGLITRLSWLLARRTMESGRTFSIYMDANYRYHHHYRLIAAKARQTSNKLRRFPGKPGQPVSSRNAARTGSLPALISCDVFIICGRCDGICSRN